MLALTIRFCFPPTSSPRPGSDGLAADVFSPQKGYRTALAHLGDPQGRSRHRRLQQVQFRRPFALSARIGATPRPKTPNGRSTRKVFENSSPSCMISSGKGLCVA